MNLYNPNAESRRPALFASLLLVVCSSPVLAGTLAGVDFPVADVMLVVLLIYFFSNIRFRRDDLNWWLWIGVFWSLFAVVAYAQLSPSLSGFVGLVYYLRFIVLLFLGGAIARKGVSSRDVLRLLILGFVINVSVVAAGLIYNGIKVLAWGEVRSGGQTKVGSFLEGNFFGLPLWGSFGVNSLAAYYAAGTCLCLIQLRGTRKARDRSTALVGLIVGGWLVYGSGSRQAILTVLAFAVIMIAGQLLPRYDLRMSFGILILGVVLILGLLSGEFFNAQELDEYATGRVSIMLRAWALVARSPFVGYGFQTRTAIEGFNIHNTILSGAIRGGVVVGVSLYIGLCLVFVRAAASRRRSEADLGWLGLVFMLAVGLVADLFVLTPVLVLLILPLKRYASPRSAVKPQGSRERRTQKRAPALARSHRVGRTFELNQSSGPQLSGGDT